MVVSMFMAALAPASALAASSAGSHTNPPTNQPNEQPTSGAVVLTQGTGYSSLGGAEAVRVLQRRLARAGYRPGPIDGRYGPRTEQAVARFQAAHGLEVDGIAGPVTFATMTGSSAALYPGAGYRGRGLGTVRALQRRLAREGYSPGPVDGRYGPLTEQAVSRFQAAHGLTANGIAGAQTLVRVGIERLPNRGTLRSLPVSSHRPVKAPTGTGQSQPEAAPRQTPPVPGTKNVVPSNHSSSPSVALIVLLIAFAGALGLAALWLANRRRNSRYAGVDGDHVGLIEAARTAGHHTNGTATSNEQSTLDQAVTPDKARTTNHEITPNQIATSNQKETSKQTTTLIQNGISRQGATPNAAETDDHDRREPEGAQRAFECGLLLEEHGDLTGAMAAYERADRLGHAAAAANLGVLLEQRGEWAAAEACYRRADQRGDANGSFNLGVLLEERNELARAMTAYKRADRLGHGAAAANLGVLLEERGDPEAAEACYRRADQRGEANGSFNLAVALEERGDNLGALRAYQRASHLGRPEIAEMARAAAQDLTTQSKTPTLAGSGGGQNGS
ncbi:MAG: peptidoglycan-binding protein [Solirubrobacterales bacterium]|nr:peptidoglycan-binding protein [Solirubrobacterales bacterium]